MLTTTRMLGGAATAALLLALGACASSGSPQTDQRFGEAVRGLRAQQVMDPNAPTRHAGKAAPTEGRVVRQGQDAYLESFRTPPATPSIPLLGISTGATNGGK